VRERAEVDLKKWPTIVKPVYKSKEQYKKLLEEHVAQLSELQQLLAGTPGPGHKVWTYRISFTHTGVYPYYCSVHAHLVKVYDHGGDHYVAAVMTAKVMGPPVDGYGGPMAGVIIVTNDPHELAITPPTAHEKILKNYFGG